jgi:hypothetical protein
MDTSKPGTSPLLIEQFDDARAALQAAGVDALNIPARSAMQRPNALLQMLSEEAFCKHIQPA